MAVPIDFSIDVENGSVARDPLVSWDYEVVTMGGQATHSEERAPVVPTSVPVLLGVQQRQPLDTSFSHSVLHECSRQVLVQNENVGDLGLLPLALWASKGVSLSLTRVARLIFCCRFRLVQRCRVCPTVVNLRHELSVVQFTKLEEQCSVAWVPSIESGCGAVVPAVGCSGAGGGVRGGVWGAGRGAAGP